MEKLTDIFKALSDPNRLRILHLLFQGEICVCDIVIALALPQSTISRNLASLKQAGLILSRKSGLWHYYSLNHAPPINQDMIKLLGNHLKNEILTQDDLRLKEYMSCRTNDYSTGENCCNS